MVKEQISLRINKYEEAQKHKLIELGSSKKSYRNILSYLENEIQQQTQMCNFDYEILCFKNDGVYQLHKAIEEIYGVAQGKGDSQVSGGTAALETVDVQLADGTRIKVPYGKIMLPDAGEDAFINITYVNLEKNLLLITGSCEFRFSSMIDEIIDRTRELLRTNSIYKNQAIELTSAYEPKIISLTNIDKEFMVLSEETEYAIKPLKARITETQKCIEKGISLKFGALLEGSYGTGKTLLAFKLAKEAVEHNWIFIYLKDPTLLAQTLRLAQVIDNNGNGVVIFVEDIDQVTRGNRNSAMQDILNTLDGGDSKQMNVITLFTTNHIELIEPTFLRGKRIGTVISLGALDIKTAEKFINYTFEKDGYIINPEGMQEIFQMIEDNDIVPAFMAEITESVKSNMILSDENVVKASYLKNSIKAYKRQRELSRTKDLTETPEKKLASAMKEVISKEMLDKMQILSDELHE